MHSASVAADHSGTVTLAMPKSTTRLERDIHEYLDSPGSDPLAATILPPNDKRTGIGTEKCLRIRGSICRCRSPHGSTRYLRYEDGEIVAGLQVVSRDGKEAMIANVYTRPEHRGRGLASTLVAQARRDFRVVRWPGEQHLSIHGLALRNKIEHATQPKSNSRRRSR